MKGVRIAAAGLLAALAAGCGLLRGSAEGRSHSFAALPFTDDRLWLAAARFAYDDFGGISTDAMRTNALPWKVVAASLALARHDSLGVPLDMAAVRDELTAVGFITPETIGNWPPGPAPRPFAQPLGIIRGTAGRGLPVPFAVEVSNLGCAACHAGVTYDARGMPTREAWLGLPNTSLDLEAFSWLLYRAIGRAMRRPDRLLAAMDTLFPGMDGRERGTVSRRLLPAIRRRFAQLESSGDVPAPFPGGGPGMTNGVAAAKHVLGVLGPGALDTEVGFVSIPDLGNVGLRSSLLADGGFAPLGAVPQREVSRAGATDGHLDSLARLIAFFTVPIMGNHPERAERQIAVVEQVMPFLREYVPPRFPGTVDSALARRGRAVYADRCASCHGGYDTSLAAPRLLAFPNRMVPLESTGTDSARVARFDEPTVAALRRTRYARHVALRRTGGYVAPRLSGLWATAPYLHNGSVPTVWHLMHPGSRPARFPVGGHALDFERLGVALVPDGAGGWRYPAGYAPWSGVRVLDTTRPGLHNGGHRRPFDQLDEASRTALLEYLKLL